MTQTLLKEQLLRHLQGGEAFKNVEDLLEDISYKKSGERPVGLPYSFYEVFYHMVYAQKDILNFCLAESYVTPSWPKDYWPTENRAETKEEWKSLVSDFFEDRNVLIAFIEDEKTDLLQVVKHGDKQSVLRELMLVIEHNAYHAGQLAIILRLLGLI
ncbi:putative damage-inducible protein DinB [Leeuwenhoekiella aestuarii]|uniref:Putative damage-inducible protein DinB n=2 Tax=Leeuwenhoekiella TaxID=283735 RepID=A0A4Q0NRB2_9FLAO|nr:MULTISPECIES: DinB family protein [Leeuwenhoekiella]RXG12275.1 putative damage-inducible protein DinB [Leeuwenhoekiella aestuarii]RXG13708.1 putative damage-inducible protein DinB [Leeuwenhoekiella aestuarii]RXG25120.1 putative damage-inducible protein DinB [Leeuwenhoekiella polynyae]